MFYCPNCNTELTLAKSHGGALHTCVQCNGRATTISLLREKLAEAVIVSLWQAARTSSRARTRRCPACHKLMVELAMVGHAQAMHMCCACEIIWIDADKMSSRPVDAPCELHPEYTLDWYRGSDPLYHDMWQTIPLVMGLPIEMDPLDYAQWPWMTWTVAAVIVAASFLTFPHLNEVGKDVGLVPAKFWRLHTYITSFLVHGDMMHLFGNMYFLVLFGRRIEVDIGWRRWLVVLGLSALGGDVAHMLYDPVSEVPCIGASGGISGLLAFYAFAFPRTRIGTMLYMALVPLPAFVIFILWIVLQMQVLGQQLEGTTNVSALAHLGGVAVGVYLWWRWRSVGRGEGAVRRYSVGNCIR